MPPSNIFEDRLWLARVRDGDEPDSAIIGTAFAIDQRHLLTCAHVVTDAGGAGPGSKVFVEFLFGAPRRLWATVLKEGWRPAPSGKIGQSAGDTALLQIPETEPPLSPLPLSFRRPAPQAAVVSYGFPESHPEGNSGRGALGPLVGLEWVRIEQGDHNKIQRGFSGGPLWCDDIGACVGMVVTRDKDGTDAAYAIPVNLLARPSEVVSAALPDYPLAWRDHVPKSLGAHMLDQRQLLRDRSKDFVGRIHIISKIDRWLEVNKKEGGYIFVEGEPGIGKSAIIAHLAVDRGYPHHFNVETDNIRSPGHFLTNICAQLVARYDLGLTDLPPKTGESAVVLTTLLTEAAARSNNPVVVLVDALDEAEPAIGAVNRLYLPKELPGRCFVILTNRSRHPRNLTTDDRVHEIGIDELDPRNKEDIKTYTNLMIGQNQAAFEALFSKWGVTQTCFVDQVSEKSEGNFMYVHSILPQLATSTLSLASGLDELPAGLESYYALRWRKMQSTDPVRLHTVQEPIICFLAAAREAIGAVSIASWINECGEFPPISEYEVERVLTTEWAQFVHVEHGDPPRYRLYHRSFLGFLEKMNLHRFQKLRAKVFTKLVDWEQADSESI